MLIGIDASRAVTDRRTGTEIYALNVIRELARQGKGHRFRLYTNSHPPTGSAPGDRTQVTPWESLLGTMDGGEAGGPVEWRPIPVPRLWTHLRLSAEVIRRPPDVLFVPAHVLPLAHPRRSVVTVHDLGYRAFPSAHRAADRLYLDWATRFSASQAAAVIADSEATKADLTRIYGVSPGRVRVVYLGRDERLAPVRDAETLAGVRARYGLAARYLLYVGTLQPRKNLVRCVEAFARLAGRPDQADLQLVLAGKRGWLYDDLFAQVERLGLAGRVSFPGYVAEGDLPALLSGALAFVFPSLYEGFGIPVLEAGACGVPVITSNTSSLPEVAGDAALLVDPHDVDAIADAMYRLVTDSALRAELARRGQANVRRFSWEKCARETLAVLEGAAKGDR
jgi:glycosyltransferase involved in cell wall biosynthesis